MDYYKIDANNRGFSLMREAFFGAILGCLISA